MRRILAAAVVAATAMLGGCFSTGTKVEAAKVDQFKPGVTTYAEVVTALGQPNTVSTLPDGQKIATYMHITASARAESFIPIVGPLVGGADTTSQSYTFVFDTAGILKSASNSQGQSGAGSNLAAH